MIPSPRTKTAAPAVVAEEPFYIPATASPSRPRRVLKQGDSFALVDSHGDIGASSGGQDGIFHCDTRYLSHFELLINGMPPLLLGSNLRDDNSALTVDLTNPDIYFNEQLALPKDTLHLVRTLFLWRGCVFHRLDIRNHGDAHLKFNISFAFDNDFADLFEVRGLKRVQRGKSAMRSDPGFGRTEIKYEGIDGKIRTSVLVFDPPPTNLPKNLASYELELQPLEHYSACLTIECNQEARNPSRRFLRSMIAASHELKSTTRRAATVLRRMHC